jgi:hypothetical protein
MTVGPNDHVKALVNQSLLRYEKATRG